MLRSRFLGPMVIAIPLLSGCAEDTEDPPSDEGEPMGGQVDAQFLGTPFEPTFGVAIEGDPEVNPDGMFIVMSTGEVNCVNLTDAPSPQGYYVFVLVMRRDVGDYVYPDMAVQVSRYEGVIVQWTGGSGGTVGITAVGERVTGSLDFSLDGEEGVTSATGTFEVTRCF